MFCEGPHLAKYASKGISKIKNLVTFLFCLCDQFLPYSCM